MSYAAPVPRSRTPGAARGLALLVVLVSLGIGAAVVAVVSLHAGSSESPPVAATTALPGAIVAPTAGAAGATSRAREVLREWDRSREAAWSAGDETALAALYLPDAVAGRRDVLLLRRWTSRGARVVRLQPQVLALRVVHEAPRRLVVRVTDRLGVVAVRVAGEPVALPRDRPTTRRIDLRRGPRATSPWRVAVVRGLGAPGTLGG